MTIRNFIRIFILSFRFLDFYGILGGEAFHARQLSFH